MEDGLGSAYGSATSRNLDSGASSSRADGASITVLKGQRTAVGTTPDHRVVGCGDAGADGNGIDTSCGGTNTDCNGASVISPGPRAQAIGRAKGNRTITCGNSAIKCANRVTNTDGTLARYRNTATYSAGGSYSARCARSACGSSGAGRSHGCQGTGCRVKHGWGPCRASTTSTTISAVSTCPAGNTISRTANQDRSLTQLGDRAAGSTSTTSTTSSGSATGPAGAATCSS